MRAQLSRKIISAVARVVLTSEKRFSSAACVVLILKQILVRGYVVLEYAFCLAGAVEIEQKGQRGCALRTWIS